MKLFFFSGFIFLLVETDLRLQSFANELEAISAGAAAPPHRAVYAYLGGLQSAPQKLPAHQSATISLPPIFMSTSLAMDR